LDEDSLRRSDNNEFPAEIFHDAFGLRLCTVADCLWDYFDHSEMKSRGEKGLLRRRKMVILDHEYIGKETNSLIDPDVLRQRAMKKSRMRPISPYFDATSILRF
jgi:hypothetical protein